MQEINSILLSVLVILILILLTYTIRTNKRKNDQVMDLISTVLKTENDKLKDKIKDDNTDLRLKIADNINHSNKESLKELNEFKDTLNNHLLQRFTTLSSTLNDQMASINNKVELRLNEGFEKTNKTFENIVERLSKIDEAQKNIEKLSTEVVSLQDVLTDKNTRGTFGEVQLNNILESIFGKGSKKIYKLQHTLSNNRIADAVLHVPEPMGDLVVDSKFPLENYRRMVNRDSSSYEKAEAKKKFKADLRRHINDIHDKYIIANETAEQAVMFIPAEAIFAEINAYHPDIIEHSQRKHVWIASPTTIMSLLTTVQVIIQNVDRNKNMKVIHEELNKLGDEFSRYRLRWDKLARSIKTVTSTVSEIQMTSEKIGKRFSAIKSVDLADIEDVTTNKIDEHIEE